MKTIWKKIMVLLLFGSLLPLALAEDAIESSNDDSAPIDEQTLDEVEIMKTSNGARIRLLQLERSIQRNIVKGEYIVSYLDNNTSLDSSELVLILEEMKLLKEEVSSADPNASDAVEVFVDLKHDAINLTKEFRETVRILLADDALVETIRGQLAPIMNNELDTIGQRIRDRIREYNTDQLQVIFLYLNESDSTLTEGYRNCSLNISEMKQRIGEQVKNMSKERRALVFSEIQEARVRKRVQARIHVDNAKEGFHIRALERVKHRLNNVNQGMCDEALENAMQNRLHQKIARGNPKFGG
jgi:hypothetical protein